MRRALVVAVAIVVVSTSCGSKTEPAAPADATATSTIPSSAAFESPAPKLTDVQQILAGQTTDQLPLVNALQLFAVAFGPVPGVTVPTGPAGNLISGTLAVQAVSDHWAELSEEQRTVIADRLGTDPASPPGTISTNTAAVAPRGRAARSTRTTRTTPDDSDGPGASVYRANLDESIRLLADRLGPLGGSAEPVHVQLMVGILDPSDVNARAHAWTITVRHDLCQVNINPTRIGDLRGPSLVLIHELFHCYETFWRNGRRGQPLWTLEGLANWVAGSVVAGHGAADEHALLPSYQEWQATPGTPLFERSYDAVGFFSLVNQSAPDLIGRVQQIVVDDSSEQAYADTVNGAADVLDRWGARQYDFSAWGSDWDLRGPEVPDIPVAEPPEFASMGNGDTATFDSEPYASRRSGTSIRSEIAEITVAAGTGGTVRHGARSERLSALGGQWCTGPSCICPPETVQAGRQFPRLDGAERFAIAIAGGPAAGDASIRGRTLLEVCGERPQCYVGRFKMAPVHSDAFDTRSGGDGATLVVAADGSFTIDLSTMAEWVATPKVDTTMENHVRFGGQVTGRLGLPSSRTDSASLHDWSPDAVTGQLSAYLNGQLVMTMDEDTARQFAAGFANPTGTWSVTPCTDSGFTFSNTGTSFVWSPA